MPDNEPALEWQRLTELYARKYDNELVELARKPGDLTPVAQQVLQSEIQRRQLKLSPLKEKEADVSFEESPSGEEFSPRLPLREFMTAEEAMAAKYLLYEAGIESWIVGSNQRGIESGMPRVHSDMDLPEAISPVRPQLFVAADDLEEAKRILPDVLPQSLILEMSEDTGDFVVPSCPSCGAENSLLEPSPEEERVNHWLCEACGRRWKEEIPSNF